MAGYYNAEISLHKPNLWFHSLMNVLLNSYQVTVIIPDFKRQPGNRSRLNRVYRFIMDFFSFSPLLFKLFMISLLCKRLLILPYQTNVHMCFVFIFVHNFLVLFSLNWK